jgi:predicted hydrocarbon binding protein
MTTHVASDYDTAAQGLLKSILDGTKDVKNRPNLGPMVPIQLFQALRLIGMGTSIEAMVGDGARALVYQSGQSLGLALGGAVAPRAGKDLGKYLELIRGVCLQLTVGQLVLEKADNAQGRLTLRVDECVSCAGIEQARAPICHFEAGLVGGVVRVFVGREVKAIETRCNAVGDNTCGIDVEVLG